MIKFVIAAAIAVVLVLVLLLRPLLWKSRAAHASRRQLNAAIYRENFTRLDQDLADGLIDAASHAQAQAEMRQRMLQEAGEAEAGEPAAAPRAPKWTVAAVGVLVPLVAVGMYLFLGRPEELGPESARQHAAQIDVEKMVAGLAAKLEKEPDNLKGWAMLARSYKVLSRPVEAEKAFDHAGAFLDNDAQLLADYADVAATNAQGNFAGKPAALIAKALKVDPENAMALWLAGTAAYQGGAYDSAAQIWGHLALQLPPDSDDGRAIQGAIREARAKSGHPEVASATEAAHPAMPGAAAAHPAASGAGVGGVVELDGALKDKAKPEDTILIIARAPGVRMPVAVIRATVAELPLKFMLDDTRAMSPNNPISALPEVSIEARISKSGMAMPEPGDLISAAQTVKIGASGVQLLVNKVRP
jgi:cytochrome c-type biogenesis protein CcmH